MISFNAIDVETANADRSSICQIGIVHVSDGKICGQWETLVDPETNFDSINTMIHGIDSTMTAGSPIFSELYDELAKRLNDSVLISHTSFDRVAIERALQNYKLEMFNAQWLDSAKIARRAWPDKYARSGYGLDNIAFNLGIDFVHHSAVEDARAAAEIVLCACSSEKVDIDYWLDRVNKPIFPPKKYSSYASKKIIVEPNPEGALYGETIAFTGHLTVSRRKAASMAAMVGCQFSNSLTSRTSILVVGSYQAHQLKNFKKSSKHQKAEQLIKSGANRRLMILSEEDFFRLVADNQEGYPSE